MSIQTIGFGTQPIPPPSIDKIKPVVKDADRDGDTDSAKESAAAQAQETGVQAAALPVDPNRGRNLDISV